MKIVFFTSEYSHEKLPAAGGLGSFLKVIAAELHQKGHEVYIVGFGKRDKELDDNGVSVRFRRSYLKRYPLAEMARSLAASLKIRPLEKRIMAADRKYMAKEVARFCEQNNADIVEAPAFNGLSAYWRSSVPMIVRFHGSRGFWHKYLGKKPEPVKTWFEDKALKEADGVIAVSNFAAKAIGEIYGISRDIKVIYNGIDALLFSPRDKSAIIPGSVFYVGTLSDAKGVDVLCRAFNAIVKTNPKASLHLIGRGEDYFINKVKTILDPAAFDNTTYYGGKQLEEIPALLAKAEVCVYPSLNETFGLVYAEAMAMEKPVIATQNRVSAEIIQHGITGYIAKDGNDIAVIAAGLLNHGLTEDTGRAARNSVLSQFTKEAMAEATIAYYLSVLKREK
jgi:glycosyltransferase involved in cell wall biosynthesis